MMNLNAWLMFAIAVIGVLLSAVTHGMIASWYYGRLTEKVAGIELWRLDASKQLHDLTQRVTTVETCLKTWIEGHR